MSTRNPPLAGIPLSLLDLPKSLPKSLPPFSRYNSNAKGLRCLRILVSLWNTYFVDEE